MKLLPNINRLKGFFKKQKPAPHSAPKQYDEAFYQNLLTSVQKQQKPIHIQFINSANDYISMILEVNIQERRLIIDELNTQAGHELAIQQIPFIVAAQFNGVSVYFTSRVIDHGIINHVCYYQLAFPERIEYLQRRKIERIVVDSDISFYAEFMIKGQPQIRAKIEDFSIAGLQMSLPRNLKPIFANIERIDGIRLISPFFPPKSFAFALKHVRFDSGLQKTFFGGQFLQLDNQGLKYLSTIQLKLGKN